MPEPRKDPIGGRWVIIACRELGTEPNRAGWRVRVVANKFPALQIDGDSNGQTDAMFRMLPPVGAHEVIIESPDHLIIHTSPL